MSESGEISIRTQDVGRAGDVQMKLTCTSTESTQSPYNIDSDDFMVSLEKAGANCHTDILDFQTAIPTNIDYVVNSPA